MAVSPLGGANQQFENGNAAVSAVMWNQPALWWSSNGFESQMNFGVGMASVISLESTESG